MADSFACGDGDREWRNAAGKLHRDDDLPAIVYADGTKMWYQDGVLTRVNGGPSIEYPGGARCWYKDGELRRFMQESDALYWYRDGMQIRDMQSDVVYSHARRITRFVRRCKGLRAKRQAAVKEGILAAGGTVWPGLLNLILPHTTP